MQGTTPRHGSARRSRRGIAIAAALSVQDPRERPLDKQQAADEIHATFHHEDSDFIAFLNAKHRAIMDQLKQGKLTDEITDTLTAVCKDLAAKYKA